MSDDIWRRRDDTDRDVTAGDATGDEYGTDFGSEFGRIQFADEPTNEPALSFGNDTTGSLPHWNESPTGEAPTMSDDTGGEPDVWATFQQPSAPTQRPGRLTIGTDPTDERARRPAPPPRDSSFDMARDPSYDITGGHSRPQSRSAPPAAVDDPVATCPLRCRLASFSLQSSLLQRCGDRPPSW